MKTVLINGREHPIKFNMSTILAYEDIMGKSFFGENFSTVKEQIALVYAAVISANSETPLKIEELFGIDDWQEFQKIVSEVMQLSSEFFHIPAVMEEKMKKEKDTEKNV